MTNWLILILAFSSVVASSTSGPPNPDKNKQNGKKTSTKGKSKKIVAVKSPPKSPKLIMVGPRRKSPSISSSPSSVSTNHSISPRSVLPSPVFLTSPQSILQSSGTFGLTSELDGFHFDLLDAKSAQDDVDIFKDELMDGVVKEDAIYNIASEQPVALTAAESETIPGQGIKKKNGRIKNPKKPIAQKPVIPQFSNKLSSLPASSSSSSSSPLALQIDSNLHNIPRVNEEPTSTSKKVIPEKLTLDFITQNWDLAAESIIEISNIEANQLTVFSHVENTRFGSFIDSSIKDFESELTLSKRFSVDGSSVDNGFNLGRLSNIRVLVAFLRHLMLPDYINQIKYFLANNIIDFSIPVVDKVTGTNETILTFLLGSDFVNFGPEKLDLLLAHCPKSILNVPNSNAKTPLLIAMDKNNLDLVRKLVDAGADINSAPPGVLTPFLASIAQNMPFVMALFLIRGRFNLNQCVNIDGKCKNVLNIVLKNSPLTLLIGIIQTPSLFEIDKEIFAGFIFDLHCEFPQMFPHLLAVFKNFSIPAIDKALNCLAAIAVQNDAADILNHLHKVGHDLFAPVYKLSEADCQLIHIAAYGDKYKSTLTLLSMGADVNAVTSKLEPLLILSCRNSGSRKTFFVLLSRGATKGLEKIIRISIEQKSMAVLKFLDYSPRLLLDLTLDNNTNMLTFAVSKDHPKLLKALFDRYGLEIFTVDSLGCNILTTARPENPSDELIELLDRFRSLRESLL